MCPFLIGQSKHAIDMASIPEGNAVIVNNMDGKIAINLSSDKIADGIGIFTRQGNRQ